MAYDATELTWKSNFVAWYQLLLESERGIVTVMAIDILWQIGRWAAASSWWGVGLLLVDRTRWSRFFRAEEALWKRIETPRNDAKTLVSDFQISCRNPVSSFCNLVRGALQMSEYWPNIIFTIQVFCRSRGKPSKYAFSFLFPKLLKHALNS